MMHGLSPYSHPKPMRTAILCVNLGTPQAPDAWSIARYLRTFLSDPRVVELPRLLWRALLWGIILPLRSHRVARAYQKIWLPEGSPLSVYSQRLVDALQTRLGPSVQVALAMRYERPALAHVLKTLMTQGDIGRLVILPLYPQYASATTGTALAHVMEHMQTWRWIPDVAWISSYHQHPLYVQALADSVRHTWSLQGKPETLMVSFHGIPKKMWLQGDPYICLCRVTFKKLQEALQDEGVPLVCAFQSRFGKAPWVEPYAADLTASLATDGLKKLDVICPGFAVDCLETLEEIAQENADHFYAHGGERYRYLPCLNDDARHVDLLEALTRPYCAMEQTYEH